MSIVPSVTYDRNHRVFTIELAEGAVARTVEFDDAHLVDLDAHGRVLSVEILTVDDPRIEALAGRFGFEDRIDQIKREVQRTLQRAAAERIEDTAPPAAGGAGPASGEAGASGGARGLDGG